MISEVFNIDIEGIAQGYLDLFPLIIGLMLSVSTLLGVWLTKTGFKTFTELDGHVPDRLVVRKGYFYLLAGMMLMTISYQTAISQNTIFPVETDVQSMSAALDQSLAAKINNIKNGNANNLFHNHLAAAVFAATTIILGFFGFISGWWLLGKKGDHNFAGHHEITGWKIFNRMFFGLLLMNAYRLMY